MVEILKWITPVILFFLAYIINEAINRNKKRKELETLKSLLLTNLEQIYDQIADQITANSNCILRLKDFAEQDLRLSRHYSNNIERIKTIPFKDIFQILVKDPSKKNKNREYYFERYNELYRILDYYETILKTLIIDNETTLKNLNNALEIWNKSHAQTITFKNMLLSIAKSKKLRPSDDSFIAGIVELTYQFIEKYGKNCQNLEVGYNELVIPLVDHSKKHSDDPRSAYLMQLLQESRYAFSETQSIRNYSRSGLEETNETLARLSPKLKAIIEEIKNKA